MASNKMRFNLKNFSFHFNENNNFFIHNVFVLYFIFILSLLYFFFLAIQGNIFSITIFIIIGFLMSFFTKNMIIILFITITLTYIISHIDEPKIEGFTIEKEMDENKPIALNETDIKEKEKDIKEKDNYNNDLEKIQEQTQLLLDTHNELIKNIDTLKPYLKTVDDFLKSDLTTKFSKLTSLYGENDTKNSS